MIPVLYAHGAGATPADPPMDTLSRLLGREYAITAPDLGPPDPEAWTRQLTGHLSGIDPRTILVGHSLGASHLLRCLAMLGPGTRPRGLVGLSAPFWGSPGWESDGFALPAFARDALSDVPIRLFHAQDDEVVPFDHLAAWHEALPYARTYPLSHGGHELTGSLAAVSIAIAEL